MSVSTSRISTPLPENYVHEVACIALEELWTVEIQPDILVDSSITISHTARKLISEIADQLTHQERLLLCCLKWEFNANEDIDQSWSFYFGQGDQDFSNPVQRYNLQTGSQKTIEFASSSFAHIKEISEAHLSGNYRYSMNIARTYLQLRAPLQPDTDYVDYLCNQVYNFCFACLQHADAYLVNRMLRYWYNQGWGETPRSILELEIITANPEHIETSINFQRACRLVTVAYCGLLVPAGRRDSQKLQSVLYCLQHLSERKASQDPSTEEIIPPYLNDYTKDLRRLSDMQTKESTVESYKQGVELFYGKHFIRRQEQQRQLSSDRTESNPD